VATAPNPITPAIPIFTAAPAMLRLPSRPILRSLSDSRARAIDAGTPTNDGDAGAKAPGAIWPARLPGAGRLRRTRTTGGYRAGPVRPAAGAGTPPGRPVYPRATEAIRMSYRAVYIYMPLLALALALAWVVGQ